jgi:hypothetical protein
MGKLLKWFLFFLFLSIAGSCLAVSSPYVYSFPKPSAEWGQAVAFGNLSPGFFQVMYQSKSGVVRIATYGIVGASMDNLKDPQLMMVFAFDQKSGMSEKIKQNKLFSRVN